MSVHGISKEYSFTQAVPVWEKGEELTMQRTHSRPRGSGPETETRQPTDQVTHRQALQPPCPR